MAGLTLWSLDYPPLLLFNIHYSLKHHTLIDLDKLSIIRNI